MTGHCMLETAKWPAVYYKERAW